MSKKAPIYIAVEKSYTGAVILSTIHNNQRVTMQYYGYSEATAKREFKKYLKTLK